MTVDGTLDVRSYSVTHDPNSAEAINAGVHVGKRQNTLVVADPAEAENVEVGKRQYTLVVADPAAAEDVEVAKRQYTLVVADPKAEDVQVSQ
jgi:hypothetical protein